MLTDSLKFLRKVKNSFVRHTPSVEVLISRENLLHNLRTYRRSYPDLSFAPVIKSNAYGHGIVQVAAILDVENVPFLVVDSLYEAMILRNEGINTDILVIGYASARNICDCDLHGVAFAVTSVGQLFEIVKMVSRPLNIHLKIDTGMGRVGFYPDQAAADAVAVAGMRGIEIEGLMSHFSEADLSDRSYAMRQLDIFSRVRKEISERFKRRG